MKRLSLIIFLGLSMVCSGQIKNNLRKELMVIFKTDQNRPTNLTDKDFIDKWGRQNLTDSINLIRITKIIDSIGYPGRSLVGDTAYLAAFYVIQHSDLKNREKYLPIIQKAAYQNEIEWLWVAMMIDRVRTDKNEKQIYGTQLRGKVDPMTGYITNQAEFYPIEDEKYVNTRRKKVGLKTIEEYAKECGVNYEIKR